jgi:hypothetical protein
MEITAALILVSAILVYRVTSRAKEGFQIPTVAPQGDPAVLCPIYILQRDALLEQKQGFEISGNTTRIGAVTDALEEMEKKLAGLGCATVIKNNPSASEVVASGALPAPPANVDQILDQAKPEVTKMMNATPNT